MVCGVSIVTPEGHSGDPLLLVCLPYLGYGGGCGSGAERIEHSSTVKHEFLRNLTEQ